MESVDCPKCNGTGKIRTELGLYEKCECQLHKPKAEEVKLDLSVLKNREYLTRVSEVIPYKRQGDSFDIQQYKKNTGLLRKTAGAVLKTEEDYISTVKELISEAENGEIKHSYLLGAPNGFGKTTLVYTLYKALLKQGKTVTPYISLSELVGLMLDTEEYRYNAGRFQTTTKPDIQGFILSDWFTSDFVAVRLTEIDSKKTESRALHRLLNERGQKDLATLVITETALTPYIADTELRQLYWADMLSYGKGYSPKDRLIHKSVSYQVR